MSYSPSVTAQAQDNEQNKGLTSQKDQLNARLRQSEEKLRLIEASLNENDALKAKVRELLDQSLGFFQEEWKRKSDYFPDIRTQSLLKLVELISPPLKKVPQAAPAVAKKT